MEAIDSPSLNNLSNEDSSTEPQTIPDFFTNAQVPLDNKIYSGSTSFSVGGPDVFSYETTYLATYRPTLVSIHSDNGSTVLEVKADACSGQKTLTPQDEADFITLFSYGYTNSEQKLMQANESTQQGCSFPRLIMDATGSNGDVELFFSTRECTPEGELHISANGSIDQATLLNQAQTYFQTHINQVCGL